MGIPRKVAVEDRAVDAAQREVERERAAVGEVGDQRAEDAQRAERDDEGLDAAAGDRQAVGGAGQQARAEHQRRCRAARSPTPARGCRRGARSSAGSSRPARKAAIEPTERSMPPPMMTKVPPTAMMPMKAERVSTLNRLVGVRNAGCISEPTTTSSSRPASGVSCCHGTRRRRARQLGRDGDSGVDTGALLGRWGRVAPQPGRVGHDGLLVEVRRPSRVPVMAPSCMTTTRWARPSISGSSLEISTTATPLRQQLADVEVDLPLGADVDAAGRLVEDDDVAAR